MIAIKNLQKQQGKYFSLSVDNLDIDAGTCLGLVGNNGAGKTTLFRLILDLIPADSGEVLSQGKPVHQNEDWKFYTGSFLDEGFLIGYLNALEYFEFVGNMQGLEKQEVLNFIGKHREILGDDMFVKGRLIRDLSQGNKAKVGIFAALLGDPEVIILDEPFAHLDPSTQIRLKKLLLQLGEDKSKTLLISSHDLKHIAEVCNRIIILQDGEIVEDEPGDEKTLERLEGYFGS